jgi:hypothetical protein
MKEKILMCHTQSDVDKVASLKKAGYVELKATVAGGGVIVYTLARYTLEEQTAIDNAAYAAKLALQTAVPDKYKNINGMVSVDLIKEADKPNALFKDGYKLMEAWKDRATFIKEKEQESAAKSLVPGEQVANSTIEVQPVAAIGSTTTTL